MPREPSPKKIADLQQHFRNVFDSPSGPLVLAHLFDAFHGNTSCYARGDTHETAFREGQRDVQLYICRMLGKPIVPETVAQMKTIVEEFHGEE